MRRQWLWKLPANQQEWFMQILNGKLFKLNAWLSVFTNIRFRWILVDYNVSIAHLLTGI